LLTAVFSPGSVELREVEIVKTEAGGREEQSLAKAEVEGRV
jgi:hypothetical protein